MSADGPAPGPYGGRRLAFVGGPRSRLAGLALAIAAGRIAQAIAEEQPRGRGDLARSLVIPERARRGHLLWLQADGSRTTAFGGRGR